MVGGGQLGRMFCFAAQAMGYRVAVLDPDENSPAGAVADRHLRAAYDDETSLTELARLCAAVSTEFENVPAASLDFLARTTFVSPAGRCVAVAQDRIAEKRFIASSGVTVAPYVVIESSDALAALDDAKLEAVLPGILKTARMGYDGKGQIRVRNAEEVREAHASLGGVPCVLEKRLPLKFEVSALIARAASGASVVYPLAQNTHRDGVLSHTIVPAPDASPTLVQQAQQAALQIADKLGYVGVLCVEFFILEDGSLVANEMAPRPHNSGHYTVDACATSQFEQQVRAMTGSHAEHSRRRVVPGRPEARGRHAAVARSRRYAGSASASVRQGRGALRPQDGPRELHGGHARRSPHGRTRLRAAAAHPHELTRAPCRINRKPPRAHCL
jgi:5-(carboxyamino)imidazole ribonucleotide synthase